MTIRPQMQVICGIHTLRTRKEKVIDPRYRDTKLRPAAVEPAPGCR